MLDRLSSAVLCVVDSETGGAYKVLDEEDILTALPGNWGADGTDIQHALRILCEYGYIDLRFSDAGTYCVRSLPKGREYRERERADRIREKRELRLRLLAVFFGALVGALLGCLPALLFVVLRMC